MDRKLLALTKEYTDDKFNYRNLFNVKTRNIGKQLTTSSGIVTNGLLTNNALYDTSDYIPVEAGKKYDIIFCRIYAMYTDQKGFTGGVNVNPTDDITFTMPIDGFIRVTFPVESVLDAYVSETIEVKEIKLSTELQGKINSHNLYGKTGLFFGDSICYGEINNGGYVRLIAENNGMTNINRGVSGSTVAKRVGENDSVLEKVTASIETADYIILEGGVNDSNSGQVPLGVFSSGYTTTLDEYTFYGAVESLLKTALLKWTGKKICYILTHNMNTRPLLSDYYTALKICCEKWAIPYLDLYTMGGMNTNIEEIRNLYTKDTGGGIGDGTHPNDLGYIIYYVPKIEAWMNML